MLIFSALGRLRWFLFKDLAASVFVYLHTASRSPAAFSTPIVTFMEFWFLANLPCLVIWPKL